MPDGPIKIDGSLDFSGGVDSLVVTTVSSEQNPNGLPRNALAWLINGTVRDGGVSPRPGWNRNGQIADGTSLYQGDFTYAPDSGTPYKLVVIGGHVLQVDVDFKTQPIDLSQAFGLFLPPSQPKAYFVQAENYVVIQAGDEVTLPLFWDGNTLTQSNGITGILAVGQPVANQFQMTTTQSWQEAAVGSTSQLVPIISPYPGNLYDNLLLTTTAGGVIGTFRVTSVTPTAIALTTISLPGAPAVIAAGVIVCTLQMPVTANNNVIIGVGNWIIPAVGKAVNVTLLTPYFGSIGDIIEIKSQDLLTDFGSFEVRSYFAFQGFRIKTISSLYVGTTMVQETLNITVTAVRAFGFGQVQDAGFPWTVAAVGNATNIVFPRDSSSYTGFVGDIVTITAAGVNVGSFRVTNINGVLGIFRPNVTVQTLASTHIGQTIDGQFLTFQVIPPNPSSENLLAGIGSWTVPPAGASVAVGIYWDWLPGGQTWYPGNVGDTVVITRNSPAATIGTFMVNAFDANGGISLQTVSSAFIGTTFSAPVTGTLTITLVPSTTGLEINQIPAAKAMVYYMGRIWYAQGRTVSAGDIVGGPSGTSVNGFIDSVLSVTECPLVIGGDGFSMPSQAGEIVALAYSNNVNASMGQGLLFAFTLKAAYALQVPVSRNDWISTNSNNQPLIVQVQFSNGTTSDRCVVQVNGDLYFQTWQPGIQSLIQAIRYFSQPGNTPISSNIKRLLDFQDRTLMQFASGIVFDNRLLMAMLPRQLSQGVVHDALVPLDFTPLSTLESQSPQVWEGSWQGLQFLQVTEAEFNGVDRAFGIVVSDKTGAIELWELTDDALQDDKDNRIEMVIEFPAFTLNKEFDLKRLVSAELWADSIRGTVDFTMEWRPDGSACWLLWHKWQVCVKCNSIPSPDNPIPYPVPPCVPGYKETMTLPKPPQSCANLEQRPADIGYQFQPRLTVKGSARVRGLLLHMEELDRKLYAQKVC